MSTPCQPLPLTGPRPSQIAALPNRKGAGEEAFRQPVSAGSAPPKQSRKKGQRTCANRRKGRCIRNPRRQHLRKSPAASKLSAPPPCSRPEPHPFALRFPAPTLPTSPHFARIVGQHSHPNETNCIKTSLISANAVFMQLDRLYVALTYLLSIW